MWRSKQGAPLVTAIRAAGVLCWACLAAGRLHYKLDSLQVQFKNELSGGWGPYSSGSPTEEQRLIFSAERCCFPELFLVYTPAVRPIWCAPSVRVSVASVRVQAWHATAFLTAPPFTCSKVRT